MSKTAPLIDIRPDHLAIVRDILRKHVPHYPVWAFGSRAKWTAKEYSDLDLAVITDRPLNLAQSAALADDFLESDLPWKVDVVDWSAISPSFRKVIEKEYVVMQEGKAFAKGVLRGGRAAMGDRETLPVAEAPLEIIDGDRGVNYPKQKDFASFGDCLFLNAGNVTTTGFDFADRSFITKTKDAALRKGKLQRYDVVLTTRGTVGNVAFFDDSVSFDDVRINSGMVLLRADQSKLLPRFLYQFVRSLDFQEQVTSLTTGSAQPQLPIRDIRRVEMPLPPLDEQRAIASVLGALDDKIEQNRRTAEALARLARAIFRAWFVDFEPVKAKAADATAFPSMPQSVFDALPTRFVDSAIGPVPKGWEVKALSSICTLVSGGTPKRSEPAYWGGDIHWYSVKDAPGDSELWVISTDELITHEGLANSAARIVPKGCTIISARGTVGKLAIAGMPMTFNQSCYGLLPDDGNSFRHLHLLMQSAIADLQQRTHGSVFDTITRATFDGLLVAKPRSEVVSSFDMVVAPLFDALLASLLESATLAKMRDYLLPKLLSGQVQADATPSDREVI